MIIMRVIPVFEGISHEHRTHLHPGKDLPAVAAGAGACRRDLLSEGVQPVKWEALPKNEIR